jgi:PAS domain S-box-containing protein
MAKRMDPSSLANTPWADAQSLLDAITDYAIYQLDPAGIVCSWNAPAQRFKGYSAQEIIGQHFSRFYTPEDIARDLPTRALLLARSEGKFEDEGWRVRADGSRIWASVVINPIWERDGAIRGFVKITRDISDKQAAQVALREAHEAMAKMQKMESLGRVAGGIAHDFNNLLTAIITSVDGMKGGTEPAIIHRHLHAIEGAAEQAAQLTSQLLAFARNQPLSPESLSIRACIEDMMPMLQSIVGGQIALSAHWADDDGVVRLDVAQFRAALVNLVTNAKDAVGGEGVITMSTRITTGLPSIRKHPPSAGTYMAISVMDNGTGIPVDLIDKVFDPFFTTKQVYHGTGLGLSQVYGFTKQSGGNVAIESGRGRGTVVTLYLPLEGVAAKAAARVPSGDAHPHQGSILFAEDNVMVGCCAVEALEEMGYRVVWCKDGLRALEALEEQPMAFDIILSDVEMPGMNGVALAQVVKARFAHIPIMLTSGYTDDIEAIASLGCVFLQKPYRMGDVVKGMNTLLRRGQPSGVPLPSPGL